jgi:AraC-like DNA-binding protein
MEKYPHILPADVYVTVEQWLLIIKERREGVPHPEITTIRLTGNSFMDLFARCLEGGCGIQMNSVAKVMGVKPHLLSPAIEAMSGLTAHEWAVQYLHLKAVDHLRRNHSDIGYLAGRLGFRTTSGFSHFFYRLERCSPTEFSRRTMYER